MTGLIELGVDQDQTGVEGIGRVSAEGEDGRSGEIDPGEACAVEEAGVMGEELVEAMEFGEEVVRGTPVESAGGVDIDLLGGAPLDAIGEAERALDAGEGAETIPVEGPSATLGGQRGVGTGAARGESGVVVGLAVVDEGAGFEGGAEGIIDVGTDRVGSEVLEEFAVGPLHAAFSKQGVGGVPGPAQAFEQEDGVGELLPDPCGDELPDVQRDLVSGVAAEGVNPTPAPGEEHACEVIPEGDVGLIELDEIFPDDIPGAGTVEATVGMAQEPFGVLVPFATAPAGVVDDEIEHEPAAAGMDAAGEFDELVDAGGALIEFDEGGIDGGEILEGVGRTETAEPGEGGGDGTDGEQMEDAGTEGAEDVGKFAQDGAEGSAGGNDGPAGLVQGLDFGWEMVRGGLITVAGPFAEHAREGAVDEVGGAGPGGMHTDPDVDSMGPVLLTVGIDGKGLGPEMTDLGEWNEDGRGVALDLHGEVAPGRSGEGQLLEMGSDDLFADPVGAPEIGPQPRLPARWNRAESDAEMITGVPHEARTGSGRHVKIRHGAERRGENAVVVGGVAMLEDQDREKRAHGGGNRGWENRRARGKAEEGFTRCREGEECPERLPEADSWQRGGLCGVA